MSRIFVLVVLALVVSVTASTAQDVRLLSHDLERIPSAATTKIQNDDGSFEKFADLPSLLPFDGYAMRFDLAADTVLQGIEYCFRNAGSSPITGFSFDLLGYPDSSDLPDDTVAGSGSAGTVMVDLPVGSSCHVVGLQDVTLDAGVKFWWGAAWTEADTVVGLEVDTSGTTSSFLAERSNGTWREPTLGFSERHFGIRLIVKDTTAAGGSGSAPSSSVSVPYFAVDPSSGVVSLYAVRNVTAADVNIAADYFMPDGSTLNGAVEVLSAGATKTVNIGDLQGLPADANGVVSGAAAISIVDASGNALTTAALTGDYFFVDPVNNFASGDPLLTSGCNRATTRFADGGVFDGTRFTIVVPNWVASAAPGFDASQGVAPFVEMVVYDEAGTVVDTAGLASGAAVLNFTTADLTGLGLTLPTFGSIEWTLADSQKGYLTWAMNAGGKFSVGMAGACLD